MEKSTTCSAPFIRYYLLLEAKIIHPRMYFRVNTTDIDHKYYLYSRTSTYVPSMIEWVEFTVSSAPFLGTRSILIVIDRNQEDFPISSFPLLVLYIIGLR